MPRHAHPEILPALVNYLHASAALEDLESPVRLHPNDLQRFYGVPETTARRYFSYVGWKKLMTYEQAQDLLQEYLGLSLLESLEMIHDDLETKALEIASWRSKVIRSHTEILRPEYVRQRAIAVALKQLPPQNIKRAARW